MSTQKTPIDGQKIVAIVGATATGKTSLAQRLAVELGGEVVSADSRQVYRYMDIGTAKPGREARETVPHHLVDVVDPDDTYSLALFVRDTHKAISEILARPAVPIVVGGTGQYVWALLEGWQVPEVPPDTVLRQALEARAESGEAAALYEELARLDPSAAERIDRRNVRRVIRAIEVHHADPRHAARHERREPGFEALVIGLELERQDLYARINQRVDEMIAAGWLEEIKGLLERGYGPDLPSMSSLGYRELCGHLAGETSLDEAVVDIKTRTRRFARQQHAWFRADDRRISWFQASDEGFDRAAETAKVYLAKS